MQPVSQDFGPCPCGWALCEQEVGPGTKLTRFGHLVSCACPSCRGRRNKRKGKRAQAQGHRALGGIGFTPSDEESTGGYPIIVQTEWKTGDQIPASFVKFVGLEWTRRALSQANRARRIGEGAMPAVGIVIGGKTWLVVECDRDMDGAA